MINESALNKMIDQVNDPELKKRLANIATGQITHQINCLSKTCKGRIIGYIYNNGTLEADELRNKNGDLISGALAIRPRFDGYQGVECACGNDSRVAEVEKGIMKTNGMPPSKDDMEHIYNNLQKKPANYIEKSGKIEVDNFIIEKVRI
jgi:hypothetical protein